MNFKVAVIGLGVIGQSQVKLFGDHVHAAYDIKTGEGYPEKKISECDFAVICVPTPQGGDGRADLTAVWSAICRLPRIPVLIRSTVPPGAMAKISGALPHGLPLAYVPEFMYERADGLWHESADVPFMIHGGRFADHVYFQPFLEAVFTGKGIFLCTWDEAAMIKYTANAHLAAKVTFVNEIARICKALGIDWEQVRLGWLHDPRAGISHTAVHDPPGFGGACLPKDLMALTARALDAGYDPLLLEVVQDCNERFRSERKADVLRQPF